MSFSSLWNYLAELDVVPKVFGVIVLISMAFVVFEGVRVDYEEDQLYPKENILDPESNLYPYDRGGEPLEEKANIDNFVQYPDNQPALGWITGYQTPFTDWISDRTPYFGTTIVSHPGGIMDEILYHTRGLDTILETTILLMGFLIATYLLISERREKGGKWHV